MITHACHEYSKKRGKNINSKLYYSSSSSIGFGAGDHKVSPCTTIISKCGNLLFLHCSFIIPKQSLYIVKVWRTWSSRSPFANGWNVQSISSSRLFLWYSEDVTKKFQLAVPNQMNQRHSVSHGIDNLHISHNASGMGPIYGYLWHNAVSDQYLHWKYFTFATIHGRKHVRN